ncbi:MAG: hypothetical protein CM15mP116_01840 [Synechococcus sp.]|nr:MAG: hypothetical protein CM15mP116_01840 [Synechococcus sp.]
MGSLRWSEASTLETARADRSQAKARIDHVISLGIGLLMSTALIGLIVSLLVFTGNGSWRGNLEVQAMLNCLLQAMLNCLSALGWFC